MSELESSQEGIQEHSIKEKYEKLAYAISFLMLTLSLCNICNPSMTYRETSVAFDPLDKTSYQPPDLLSIVSWAPLTFTRVGHGERYTESQRSFRINPGLPIRPVCNLRPGRSYIIGGEGTTTAGPHCVNEGGVNGTAIRFFPVKSDDVAIGGGEGVDGSYREVRVEYQPLELFIEGK